MNYCEAGLTAEENEELSGKIAGGNISRSCQKSFIDWFNIKLSNGTRVCGSYFWNSEGFRTCKVYRKK